MDTKVIDKELIATLPSFLRFKSADDLVRVGKANDSGYLISQSDIEHTNWVIGLGLGYDWSFERDFLRIKNVPLQVFDASVHFRHFFEIATLIWFDLISEDVSITSLLLFDIRYSFEDRESTDAYLFLILEVVKRSHLRKCSLDQAPKTSFLRLT